MSVHFTAADSPIHARERAFILLACAGLVAATTACSSADAEAGIALPSPSATSRATVAASVAVVSPDGAHVADIRPSDGGNRICLRSSRGGVPREVVGQVPVEVRTIVVPQGSAPRAIHVWVPREGDVVSVAWSADGRRLTYEFRDSAAHSSVKFSITLDGATPTQLTPWSTPSLAGPSASDTP
ncbi:hypothetical protein [Glaciihabitans sp. dw_435]|uniref:hypothetical protein n=1 Tax=Glaciihabitans sp. dw_435 TaxID=2720081 RepID=UPI001BD3EAE7|nr:hypothetical protein [Glaciihabitans sp. dw_435]